MHRHQGAWRRSLRSSSTPNTQQGRSPVSGHRSRALNYLVHQHPREGRTATERHEAERRRALRLLLHEHMLRLLRLRVLRLRLHDMPPLASYLLTAPQTNIHSNLVLPAAQSQEK